MKKVLLGGVALITLGLAGSAFAADMPVKAPVVATNTWTGFYIGVDFGGVRGMNNTESFSQAATTAGCFDAFGAPSPCSKFDPVTFQGLHNWGETGGVHAGYNLQLSPSWVVGVEADWDKTALGNSPGQLYLTTGGGPVPTCLVGVPGAVGTCHGLMMSNNLEWTATARGRLGFTFGSAMLYATGGGAYASISTSGQVAAANFNSFSISTSTSHNSGGWVAGGGLEVMATANWLVRLEYLRYAFSGTTTVVPCSTCIPGGFSGPGNFTWSNATLDVIRGAISYKF
jgi:outer membrane immunogenic protein